MELPCPLVILSVSRKKVIFGLYPGPRRVQGGVEGLMGLIPYNPDIQSYKGPFINYGSGGVWKKLGGGGLETKSQQGGGLPKLFCLMRECLKKINLFHQIILVKETNIVEYLVLM